MGLWGLGRWWGDKVLIAGYVRGRAECVEVKMVTGSINTSRKFIKLLVPDRRVGWGLGVFF